MSLALTLMIEGQLLPFSCELKMHESTFLTPGLLKRHCCLFCDSPVDVSAQSGICQNLEVSWPDCL